MPMISRIAKLFTGGAKKPDKDPPSRKEAAEVSSLKGAAEDPSRELALRLDGMQRAQVLPKSSSSLQGHFKSTRIENPPGNSKNSHGELINDDKVAEFIVLAQTHSSEPKDQTAFLVEKYDEIVRTEMAPKELPPKETEALVVILMSINHAKDIIEGRSNTSPVESVLKRVEELKSVEVMATEVEAPSADEGYSVELQELMERYKGHVDAGVLEDMAEGAGRSAEIMQEMLDDMELFAV